MKRNQINVNDVIRLIESNNIMLKSIKYSLTSNEKEEKDYSKWLLDDKMYNKVNFTLAVFKKYMDNKLTLSQIRDLFGTAFPKYFKNKDIFCTAEISKPNIRLHNNAITTSDGVRIYLTNQWGKGSWFYFLKAVHDEFDFPLVCEKLTPSARRIFRSLNFSGTLFERSKIEN